MHLRFANASLSLVLLALAWTAPRSFADEIGEIGEAHVQAMTSPLIGTRAPKLDITLMNGDKASLGALAGNKPVYLKFWATWCLPCREQMPHLQSTYDKYGNKIQFLSVNAGLNDSVESVQAFQEEFGLTVPLAIDTDGAIGRAFKLTVTPQHILIDRSGAIRYIGHMASAELDKALAALLKDEGTTTPPLPDDGKLQPDMPPESLALLDGATFHLENTENKPTVLFFFAAWCDWYLAETRPEVSSRCIAFQEAVRDVYEQYGEQVRIVGVAQSLWTNTDYLKEYQARLDVQYPIGLDLDSAWFAAYGIREVPAIVVLDAKNKIASTLTDSADSLEELVSRLAAD